MNSLKLITTQELGGVFDPVLLEERSGFVSVLFQGTGARSAFSSEAGGHRWQRLPPNEKRGRVHTSTVTVAVLDPLEIEDKLDFNELTITTTKGSGPGGQHRNKTESCVVIVHNPTGLTVRIDGRSQHQNKAAALKLIATRLQTHQLEVAAQQREDTRREQVGSGMRGDKIRTYRVQDDQVNDHRTGQRWRLRDWVKGIWE